MSAEVIAYRAARPRRHVVRRARAATTPRQDEEQLSVKSAVGWRFQWHEEVLKRRDLSRSEIAIAGVLMHRFDARKGFAEIGLAKLAERAGCARSMAARATKRLRRLGLLVVDNEGVRKTNRALETCRYRLTYTTRGVV